MQSLATGDQLSTLVGLLDPEIGKVKAPSVSALSSTSEPLGEKTSDCCGLPVGDPAVQTGASVERLVAGEQFSTLAGLLDPEIGKAGAIPVNALNPAAEWLGEHNLQSSLSIDSAAAMK